MQELVSVIMPAYNAEKTISEAIDSVSAQTYHDWELIIIDDCSTDATACIAAECAENDKRIKLIRNIKNLGTAGSRHIGASAARGKFLAFLDSDDIWACDKLEKQMKLHTKTGARLSFTASGFIDTAGRTMDSVLHIPEKVTYRRLLKQNIISNSSVVIDKQLYMKHLLVRNDIHEDFACWLNVLKCGETAFGIDEPLFLYRLSDKSKSHNKLCSALMTWRTYRAVGLNFMKTLICMFSYTVNGVCKYMKLFLFR